MAALGLTGLRNLLSQTTYYVLLYVILAVTVAFLYFTISEIVFVCCNMHHSYKVMAVCLLVGVKVVFSWGDPEL